MTDVQTNYDALQHCTAEKASTRSPIKHSFGSDIPVRVDYRYDREPTSAPM